MAGSTDPMIRYSIKFRQFNYLFYVLFACITINVNIDLNTLEERYRFISFFIILYLL